jgi:hypothetical protein
MLHCTDEEEVYYGNSEVIAFVVEFFCQSSKRKLYDGHHNLVDRYEISTSQMTMNRLLFMEMFSLLYHCE